MGEHYENWLNKRCAELEQECSKLRNAIITHRSQKADDRCIEDDDKLYEALGDGIKCDRRVGSKKEMLHNCDRFIENRCEEGGWPTYAELEEKIKLCQVVINYLYYHSDYELVHESGCKEINGMECKCYWGEKINKCLEGCTEVWFS
ncbi:hypothetical protein C4577_05025 [Candidatus Parcubacteria bacterium]|nr:MAG: hypothetical protein C4577_05025 [Candidatus Parcubacteria bacterium]